MGKSRLPAVVATLVAVPAAVVAGVVVFNLVAPAAEEPRFDGDRSAVTVEAPELSDDEAVVCLAVTASAPEEVGGLPARPVEGGPRAAESVLAYGDPAVVATCGAERVEIEDTAPIFLLNGVCWFTEEDGDGREWVTMDRTVPVGVSFPEEYEQTSDVLNELSVVVEEKVPVVEDGPSNC
ncbi:hypothetical protein GCM10027447_08900 [Glycomyces halotolerans]